MFFAIPAGRLADRVGVRGPMLAGSIGMACGAVDRDALVPGLPALFVTAVLLGLSFMAFQVAAQYATGEMGGRRRADAQLRAARARLFDVVDRRAADRRFHDRSRRLPRGVRPACRCCRSCPIAVLASNRVPFPGPHPAHDAHARRRARST